MPGYPQKSKVAAGVLGILLGGFGAHNFYLGYTGKAVLQLVLGTLCSCGIASLWGFIEGILILTGSIGNRRQRRPPEQLIAVFQRVDHVAAREARKGPREESPGSIGQG